LAPSGGMIPAKSLMNVVFYVLFSPNKIKISESVNYPVRTFKEKFLRVFVISGYS